MTLRQLEYLVAIVDEGSFTRAAQRLHVSQPSLSQQIRALEDEVGGRLLDRESHPLRLTSAGRALVAQGRVAVRSAQDGLAAARRAARAEPRAISVATVRSLAVSMLPPCLSRWHEEHPEVRVELQEYAHRREVERVVRDGGAELGVGPAPPRWTGAIRRLGWDQLAVVLPPGDALLQSDGAVALESMANREWVLFEASHGLAENVDQACAIAGFEPTPVVRTAQVEAAARLASSGLGPALVPIKNVPVDLRDTVRRLDPPIVWELAAFARRRRFDRVAQAFVATLAEGEWLRRHPRGATILRLG